MWQIGNAKPEEYSTALPLAFARLPPAERDTTIDRAVTLLARGSWTPEGIWVARDGSRLVGVVIAQPLPGASCLFWLPVAEPDCADALVASALTWCHQRGCKIAQAFYAPDQFAYTDSLLRNGFRHITRLHHLEYSFLLNSEPERRITPELQFISCAEAMPAEFGETLLRTYEDSLDCPELDGMRGIDEIIAGHRGIGVHHPDCWWLVRHGTHPIGVVLLTEIAGSTVWELAYLGVTPEHRGRGWGRWMTLHALSVLRARNVERLTLAVDGRNLPARRLYGSLGFTENEPLDVVLRFLAPPER